LTYNYGTTNNNGNLLSTTYAGGGLSYTQTFGYDALNRLTTSQEGATWSQTNSYDRYGNRAIVGAALSFNAANNRITTAGYIYDAVGNLTNDSTQAFTYDAENKIIKVDNVAAYVYDGEGQADWRQGLRTAAARQNLVTVTRMKVEAGQKRITKPGFSINTTPSQQPERRSYYFENAKKHSSLPAALAAHTQKQSKRPAPITR
jgi:hypothetical protein